MSKKKHASLNYFWPSYADLMTTLFFIMLVLYVLTYLKIQAEKEQYRIKARLYDRIQAVEKDVQDLTKRNHFSWDSTYKRLGMTQRIQFDLGKYFILNSSDIRYLTDAGRDIKHLIDTARDRDKYTRYLIILEGMASKDNSDPNKNYELSYNRARQVLELWKRNGIRFDPEICEVLIAGSGFEGVGRDDKDEEKNQRVLVQIIPKIWQSDK